ncbi:MAG TPA: hypothetical protein DDX85_01665, partial [Nitrospiraceae bacterium]|nr:hypothetical protein [Nitrospiraceae bacterium]
MIIGIAIPSFIAFIGGVFAYGYISDVLKRQGYELIADEIRDHVLEVRRNEKNLYHFKNAEHLNNLHNAISSLNKLIDTISPGTISEIGKGDFSLLQNNIKKYLDLTNSLYSN